MIIKGKTVLITGGASNPALIAINSDVADAGDAASLFNRFFPKIAFGLVNPVKTHRSL